MRLLWEDRAWDDYLYWQAQDKRTIKRINMLIKEIRRDPASGIGKCEPLKGDLRGLMSRRIDDANRLIYYIENDMLYIIACRGHYD